MEKMLVTQALDERDLLADKIADKIIKADFINTIKHNEEHTFENRITRAEFEKQSMSSYQQIMDLIDGYNNLNNAIVSSNAETMIDTSKGKMSVASAISLRARIRDNSGGLNFEQFLIEKLEESSNEMIARADDKNRSLQLVAEDMRRSILGKDSKVKDDKPLAIVDEYIKENKTELVDPLNAKKKIEELSEAHNKLLKELETQIKVSNATTFIEL